MSTTNQPLGYGVIGVGFMGKVHVRAVQAAAERGLPCRLVAVADSDPERRAGRVDVEGNLDAGSGTEPLFDTDEVRGHATPEELLADGAVDLVSICTRTDTHVDLAIAALEAGKHVLVEKPVALNSADVQRLADAAQASDRIAMPAMCVRFWPGWAWLAERVREGDLGKARSAVFRRLGSRPSWSTEFYGNSALSGGALFDLHVHDADFVRYCFGNPTEVRAAGGRDHVTALYRFDGGPDHVVAEGGWDHAPGFGFHMQYVVVFDDATADYDLGRDEPLMLHRGAESEAVELPGLDGYETEISHFIDLVSGAVAEPIVTMDDALAVTRLLETELASTGVQES